MSLTYEQIEKEVEALPNDLLSQFGAKDVMLAYLQGQNDLNIMARCPRCFGLISYSRFEPTIGCGVSLKCDCGQCTTSFRGL